MLRYAVFVFVRDWTALCAQDPHNGDLAFYVFVSVFIFVFVLCYEMLCLTLCVCERLDSAVCTGSSQFCHPLQCLCLCLCLRLCLRLCLCLSLCLCLRLYLYLFLYLCLFDRL